MVTRRGGEWAERDKAVNWTVSTVFLAFVTTFLVAIACFALAYLIGRGISQETLGVTWRFVKRIAFDKKAISGKVTFIMPIDIGKVIDYKINLNALPAEVLSND